MSDDDKKTEKAQPFEKTEALLILATTTAALGFPVPPTIAKSIMSAVSALVTAGLAVPTAYLEAWAQGIRAEGSAKETFAKGAAAIALSNATEDKELAKRATLFLGGRILREQKNREAITDGALEELRANPPTEDSKCEIEEDWLDMFARHAERKSDKDMQAYFSRVLAGEIRKPGSFSPTTVEVLARLTPTIAKLYQQFCNISLELSNGDTFVLAEPFGPAGVEGIPALGLPFPKLLELQDAGLLSAQIDARWRIPVLTLAASPFVLGGAQMTFTCELPREQIVRRLADKKASVSLHALLFTRAGQELRKIVHMTPNHQYVEKFIEWAAKHKMRPISPPVKH